MKPSHAPAAPTTGTHAVVIGGSVAGLLAARVLAGHFHNVTIIERDQLPDEPSFRKGVPQARHLHQLLLRGKQILEDLFPGLEAELLAAGAHPIDLVADAQRFSPSAGWGPRYPSPFQVYACSRDLLEWQLRKRLQNTSNITFLHQHTVMNILAGGDGTRITGVQIQAHGRPADITQQPRAIMADLVVDASGCDSRMPAWLEALGYGVPPTRTVNAFLGYASRYYEPPHNFQANWKMLWILNQPPELTRVGAVFPIEGGRWMVTFFGAARDYPPTDEAGFHAFARGLAHPAIAELLQQARPLSPIYGYRRTENQRRHYEQMPRMPEGLIVVGDAVCSFNPFYGQGMTIAALAATVLETCLHEQRQRLPSGDLTGLSKRFQQRLARSMTTPWLLATGSDFLYPTTEGGKRSWLMKVLQMYTERAWRVSGADPRVYNTFLEVMNCLKPPTALFHPAVVWAVLGAPSYRAGGRDGQALMANRAP